MAGEMNSFVTNSPTIKCETGDNIIYPFSPPIFQSEVSQKFIDSLLNEGDKLTREKDDWRHKLAGNLKHGGSYIYNNEYTKKVEKYLLNYVHRFLNTITETFGPAQVERMMEKSNFSKVEQKLPESESRIALDTCWINYQKRYDFNPPHNHKGVLSFVIFCKIPNNIFKEQAVSNSPEAGKILFQHGENNNKLMGSLFPVRPYEKLLFIFPSSLNHFVPAFWVDETRISVSGNFIVV